ncbi:tRNA 4-thiouridine(8) synthase ThiI [Halobacteriales archaeon QS_1_68_20]|nr:MAG: tRNA 4-thiouridine(8) synthase ThiI [Halobacteriales archaeon QS_1_68_20]
MLPPGADTVVVRYGDASTKSARVQRRMEDLLVENLRALLADRGVDGDVEQHWTRPLIRTDEVESALDAATDAFGVANASGARSVAPDLDAVVDALAETAAAVYDGGTFAVDASRAGDHDFTSEDVEGAGGAAVWDAVADEFDPEVDLDDPDLTFGVEVREAEAFVYLEKRRGPGGLPLGSQRPLVALVSGGIDSPVAAYLAMKRGSPVVPVYLDLGEYGGPDHRARALTTVGSLERYAPNFDLTTWVVPAGDAVADLVAEMEQGRMLSYRRFMYRVGEAVAERVGADGIVTGEAIGQKSSQTTRNVAVTSRVTDLPIHRPLLTMDKQEITDLAQGIGTYTDSTIPAGCYRIAPDRVETNASLERLLDHEPDDLLDRASEVVADAERVDPLAPADAPGI